MRRPAGITLLAVLNYFAAAWSIFFAIICLMGAKAMVMVYSALGLSNNPADAALYTLKFRLLVAGGNLVAAFLVYLLAQGLWRVRNWARVITMVLSALDLIAGGWPSELWPVSHRLPGSPPYELLGRILSVIVLSYLLSPHVKSAFGITATSRKWQTAVSALALISVGYALSKSAPELNAIRWHRHHGDRITVNGVTFPVYYWFAPEEYSDEEGFEINDKPGPLRPADSYTVIEVKGFKETNADRALTVEQLVDKKIEGYERAHYTAQSKFQLQVGRQTLSCMQESMYGNSIYCYGDGPIYSVFFVGGDASLDRFKRMMAKAR